MTQKEDKDLSRKSRRRRRRNIDNTRKLEDSSLEDVYSPVDSATKETSKRKDNNQEQKQSTIQEVGNLVTAVAAN